MREIFFCSLLTATLLNASAQLNIGPNAVFYLQGKASVYLEGSLSSSSNIEGDGYIEFGGKQIPRINMNGYYINNLLVNAHAPALLETALEIRSSLVLKSGHLELNNYDLTLQENALVSGSNKAFVVTTGTGKIRKRISGGVLDYFIPVGTSQAYMPLQVSTNGKSQHGYIEVKANDRASNHKPPQVKDYLKYYWSIKKEGNLEDVIVSGRYQLAHVEGNAGSLSAYYWDGFDWRLQSTLNINGKVTAAISSPIGELYAMNEMAGNITPTMRLLNNPARSFTVLETNLQNDETYHVILRDITGRQLQQTEIKATMGISRHTFFLQGLSNGAYFLDVSSAIDKQSFRFIKVE